MSRPAAGGRFPRREQGQVLVIFALGFVVFLGMAGLLVDGGRAFAERRQRQAGADTGALAAALAIVNSTDYTVAARAVAAINGIPTDLVDCNGGTQVGKGVIVNNPPSATPEFNQPVSVHAGDDNYVEVITTKAMTTTFAGAVGQSCWLVSARAVAIAAVKSVANCSFCSLDDSNKGHTLLLQASANLRVDGDIYVNSSNGGTSGACVPVKFKVCGDGFDVFGSGGYISAQTISVVGGWETHSGNIATADTLALLNGAPCPLHPDPPSAPTPPSNVCIHMPVIPDPLNDPAKPENRVSPPDLASMVIPSSANCPAGSIFPTGSAGSPVTLTVSAGTHTLCPGVYHGGVAFTGGTSTLLPGVYYMAGGGFEVLGSAAMDGSSGVMIYNTSGTGASGTVSPGDDLFPDGISTKINPDADFKVSDNDVNQGTPVTFTYKVKADGSDPAATGTVAFYDGFNILGSCGAVVLPSGGLGVDVTATCGPVTFVGFGTHYITAVYSGDSVYNPAQCNIYTDTGGNCPNVNNNPLEFKIKTPTGSKIDKVTIENTSGNVQLYGPSSGTYAGLTIFQDRSSNLGITIAPAASNLAACGSTFMTDGVPGTAEAGNAVPAACGVLGGIRGTIYAPGPSYDATVTIEASGLSNMQVISGRLLVNAGAKARFAFTPNYFVNGQIRLVE